MNGKEIDIFLTKSEVEWFKKTCGNCFGCLFFHLERTYCNSSSAYCTRPDGHSLTFMTTKCGIEPPKTHD